MKKSTEVQPSKKKAAKAVANKPTGGRGIVKILPSQNKAILRLEGKEFRAYCHRKTSTGVLLVAKWEGGPSVPMDDWVNGKAEL